MKTKANTISLIQQITNFHNLDEFSHSQLRAVTPVTKHVHAPETRPAPPSTGGLPAGQNICAECERLIV